MGDIHYETSIKKLTELADFLKEREESYYLNSVLDGIEALKRMKRYNDAVKGAMG